MANSFARPAEILLQRIDARLQAMGKTRYWLSKTISDGKRHGIVTDIERKGTMPGADRLRRMAEALETTTDYLVGTSSAPEQIRSEVSVSDRALDWRGPDPQDPGIPLVGTGDCADLAVTDTETGLEIMVERSSFDPEYTVRYVARPPALRGVRGIYAIYFSGSSMEPRFYPHEVGLIDPHRAPSPGEYVLVQMNGGDSDDVVSVLVKKLVRRTAKEVILEQYNPPQVFSVPAQRVTRMHRVMPQTELLFG